MSSLARTLATASATAALALAFAPVAAAQQPFPACESQNALEQVIASDGQLMPDDCRTISVTSVDSDSGDLCVIDFASSDQNMLQALRDAALPEQWWVRCDSLEQAAD